MKPATPASQPAAPPPYITLQPKKLFLSDAGRAASWNETAGSNAFLTAANAAYSSFAHKLRAKDMQEATMNALKIEGARGVLEELLLIGSLKEPSTTPNLIPPLNNT